MNVALVGAKEELIQAMRAAGWYPADAVTVRTSIEIADSVRPYREAPVSPLFYDGRQQDLAFEKPVGRSAHKRNHVRFREVLEKGEHGRPVWLGSATFDQGAGFSHDTGQITHHIAPDIDAERELLTADLNAAEQLIETLQMPVIGPTNDGRNGDGDPYETDGQILLGVLVAKSGG